ncbi:alpha/beta hydrolase [Roseimicrobium sp. ORNL1]|uniref:alpha/beta hydrolase n=1 Tax=Roseimicrobium sp. ORNL1 TaxID=2711231 RepID=UPI0013E0F60A|nr:alpha/beta hydrolase [Roseimicrobium sp. ORNL1]QIF01678.1 alpha/beta hydrolase [Roseimicrobium sp. ORNL1]
MSHPRSRFRRILGWCLRIILLLVLLVGTIAGVAWWYFHPAITETRGVVYTQRNGQDLTLDVYRPAHQNGATVLIMVSGSWKSNPKGFQPWMVSSLLRKGLTVVTVSHLSQPKASVMEIVADVQRATRYVRHHAAEYGIKPDRFGVVGGSSGGHLALMLATCGGPGDAAATDPVERESAAVQAAAVFFPVTDLLNLGPSTENAGDNGPPKSFRNAFGPDAMNPPSWQVIGRSISPIYHITAALPPIRIAHGDADTLVPLDQSIRFQAKAAELGHKVLLEVKPGQKHGWLTMLWDAHVFAGWFVEVLGRSE